VGEDIDDRAAGVLDEEAPYPPRLVPERIDNTQSALHRRGVRGVDSLGFAEVDPESWRGIVESGWRDEHLGAAVGRRGESENRVFHHHFEAEQVVAGEGALYGDGLGPANSAGATYLGMMEHNTRTIVSNLTSS
jgi:hypothetical protein